MRIFAKLSAAFILSALTLLTAQPSSADDGERLVRLDHYIFAPSEVPAIKGQTSQIYVREVVLASAALRQRSLDNRVVLFVHGAGTPAEVAFDVPYEDYSWMAYLARAGFDVFAMDVTGYGRSTRPPAMNNPCNLTREQQLSFVPGLLPAPCAQVYTQQMTTIASDWADIGAVVDNLLALRQVGSVSMIAWSLGGPRAGGYAARHPDKVKRLVLLAPAYNRAASADPPARVPANGVAMNTQSQDEFTANWDRQVGCPNQYDPAASKAVWTAMTESDPVGATWGTGVRRAPSVTSWGWNSAVAAGLTIPALLVSGAHDKQVAPERVRDLYTDLGSRRKVFVDLACASHNALWEKNHLLLFQASLDWLVKGKVNGIDMGMTRLGY
ncbi:MAG: alpha/beta fold hydrolase [Terriglobia bacterium]